MRSSTSKKKTKAGKLNMGEMRKLINKKAGTNVAHDLTKENPTEVKEWIPTGSRWLDSIVCRGKLAGIPVGKVTEIAGLEATGKSYMAAQIAANAQKMGIGVVYFDSESAIDPDFLQRTGCDLSNLLYIQATTVEFVLESIEELIGSGQKLLFIWDSLALTTVEKDLEGDYNPQSSMAVKARILSKGMPKLTVPLANAQCTFLVLNQLRANITSNIAEAMTTPFFTPGGRTMIYTYSLRIWLTGRKAKASFVIDEKGFRIGSEVKAKLQKSRFGTEGRMCNFKILWGADIAVRDEESWLDAIKGSNALTNAGAWYTLTTKKGKDFKFQGKQWIEKLQDPEFRQSVFDIMDEEIIMKFDKREGDAKEFYDSDGEGEA